MASYPVYDENGNFLYNTPDVGNNGGTSDGVGQDGSRNIYDVVLKQFDGFNSQVNIFHNNPNHFWGDNNAIKLDYHPGDKITTYRGHENNPKYYASFFEKDGQPVKNDYSTQHGGVNDLSTELWARKISTNKNDTFFILNRLLKNKVENDINSLDVSNYDKAYEAGINAMDYNVNRLLAQTSWQKKGDNVRNDGQSTWIIQYTGNDKQEPSFSYSNTSRDATSVMLLGGNNSAITRTGP
jgi:hypothetical protein